MGTTSTSTLSEDEYGILPRSFDQIFETIINMKKEQPQADFVVRASFLEIYGEELRDLLEPNDSRNNSTKDIQIREGDNGEMLILGCSEIETTSPNDLMDLLTRVYKPYILIHYIFLLILLYRVLYLVSQPVQ